MRLTKFTFERGIEAIESYLLQAGWKVESKKIVYLDGCTWFEFKNLKFSILGAEEDEIPILRCLAATSHSTHDHWIDSSQVLALNLHDADPTPKLTDFGTHRLITTINCFMTVALLSTSEGIEAREFQSINEGWGERRVWPFKD